jgi:hypothetical protein
MKIKRVKVKLVSEKLRARMDVNTIDWHQYMSTVSCGIFIELIIKGNSNICPSFEAHMRFMILLIDTQQFSDVTRKLQIRDPMTSHIRSQIAAVQTRLKQLSCLDKMHSN